MSKIYPTRTKAFPTKVLRIQALETYLKARFLQLSAKQMDRSTYPPYVNRPINVRTLIDQSTYAPYVNRWINYVDWSISWEMKGVMSWSTFQTHKQRRYVDISMMLQKTANLLTNYYTSHAIRVISSGSTPSKSLDHVAKAREISTMYNAKTTQSPVKCT